MKTKMAVISIMVIITVLLSLIPIAEVFTSPAWHLSPIPGEYSIGFWSIKDYIISGDYFFVIVFFPLVFVCQIIFSEKMTSKYWRIVFASQGFIVLSILLLINLFIDFNLLDRAEIKFGYYVFFIWLLTFCIISILAGMQKFNAYVQKLMNDQTKERN